MSELNKYEEFGSKELLNRFKNLYTKEETIELYNKHLENIKTIAVNKSSKLKLKWITLNNILTYFNLDKPVLGDELRAKANVYLDKYFQRRYDFGELIYKEGTFTPFIVVQRDDKTYSILEGRHRISALHYYFHKNNMDTSQHKILCIIIPPLLSIYKEQYFHLRDYVNPQGLEIMKQVLRENFGNKNDLFWDFYYNRKKDMKASEVIKNPFNSDYPLLFNFIHAIVMLNPYMERFNIAPPRCINNEQEYYKWINNLI